MRRLILVLAILLAAYIGYPYLTLYWLDQALLTDDDQALSRLVDFPQVRETLKAEVKLAVLDRAQEAVEKRPILGTFGAALASLLAPALVDSAVDTMVTPEAILNSETVVKHRREGKSFFDFVTYAFFAGPTEFTVDLKDPQKPDSPTLTAVMELTGLRWRIVALKLPPVENWYAKPAD
ncbi:MAG TPA: DUF2939 domain-containing protein [Methyloceanibacter sp.]|nr:DUF2939 domain-containing protein [Methyloceanibacter sp.]